MRFPASVEFSTMRELVFSKFSTFYSTFVENSEKKEKLMRKTWNSRFSRLEKRKNERKSENSYGFQDEETENGPVIFPKV